jgi:hypothetical protein
MSVSVLLCVHPESPRPPASAEDVLQRGTMSHHALERLFQSAAVRNSTIDDACLSRDVTRLFDGMSTASWRKRDKPPEFLYRVRRLTETL